MLWVLYEQNNDIAFTIVLPSHQQCHLTNTVTCIEDKLANWVGTELGKQTPNVRGTAQINYTLVRVAR